MLVIPLDTIALLLDRASGVEIDEADGQVMTSEAANDDEDEAFAQTDAYQALSAALDDLSGEEIAELLALAAFGEQDDADASWELAQERARSADQEDGLDTLMRALLYTDAIETALDRLGLQLPESEAEEETETGKAEGEESASGETAQGEEGQEDLLSSD
jgi:Protein of unknown function (DUF3775)